MGLTRVSRALREGIDTQAVLRVDRTPKFADRIEGIVLQIGARWVLMAQTTDGGYFDGFAAFRLRDAASITLDPTFAGEFAKTQPEWPPSSPFDVDLDSTTSVLSSFARGGELIGLQKERERSAVWIGTLDEMASRFVYLNEVKPDATWHPRPLGYKLRSITMVEAGSRYLRGLSAIAGPGPGRDGTGQ